MPYPLTQVGRARTPVLDTTYAAEKRSVRSHASENQAGTMYGRSWMPIDQSDLQRLYRH